MNQPLRRIAQKRVELSARAQAERRAVAENGLWSSGPVLLTNAGMEAARSLTSRSHILRYSALALLIAKPQTTLKWAGRGLSLWVATERFRKAFLR